MRLILPDRRVDVSAVAPRAASFFRGAERIVLATEDEEAAVIAAVGARRAGATLVPLDPRAPAAERLGVEGASISVVDAPLLGALPHAVEAARPPVRSAVSRLLGRAAPPVTSFPGNLASLPPAAPVEGEVAVWLRTSGTTGRPKIVPMRSSALRAQLPILREALLGDRDAVVMNLLPGHHIDGLVMGTWMVEDWDATLVRPGRFVVQELPTIVDLVVQLGVTHLVAPPAILALLLRSEEDLGEVFARLRLFVSTAAPLPTPVWAGLEEATKKPVVNVYGLTETGNLFFTPPQLGPGRHGTVGRAHGVEWRVVEGELQLRGPTVMTAYADGSSPLVDGFYPTGDLVEAEGGLLRVIGRSRSMISVGGQKVGPAEVEEALLACPGVRDAWVRGEADPLWGERVVADVVVDGDPDLHAALRHRLSEHKLPRHIERVERIDRGATGKVRQHPVADPADGVLALAATVFRVPVARLRPSMGPDEVPGWDSVGHLDLVAALEKAYGFRMAARDVIRLRTLADAIRIVERR